jgi:hypothetical protein
MTAKEAAESLYGAVWRPVTPETAESYGLPSEPRALSVLSLALVEVSLYWVWSAVRMMQKPPHQTSILAALRARLAASWDPVWGDAHGWWLSLQDRMQAYEARNRDGGPMAVSSDVVDQVIDGDSFTEATRSSLLAFFIDMVPVDELGELVAEIQLSE